MNQLLNCWLVLLVGLGLGGCSSARMSDRQSDRFFQQGQYQLAVAQLKKGLEKQGEKGRDLLLYLLDLGLALHTGGWHEESIHVFHQADQIAEIKDYTSLAAETATLFTTDNLKDYRAEEFENVLISVYLAMNYALLNQMEDALVEAKRVNQKLYRMITEAKRKYQENAFARYLSAILYESAGKIDEAYIDYKKVYRLNPKVPGLGSVLWRSAKQLNWSEEMGRWDQEYHLTAREHRESQALVLNPELSELIIFYENGIGPEKKPNPLFYQLPKFYPRPNPVRFAEVEVDGMIQAQTFVLEDIESVAIQNLDEKYGGLIAKKLAGVLAKETVGAVLDQQDPILGIFGRLFLYASDQADLRSWKLLPKELQLARILVSPGVHKVRVLPVGALPLAQKIIQIHSGEKRFLNFRYIPS